MVEGVALAVDDETDCAEDVFVFGGRGLGELVLEVIHYCCRGWSRLGANSSAVGVDQGYYPDDARF